MIDALLKGKLSREQENMEDVLTSAVFGRLKYVPPPDGLLRFLAEAKRLDGTKPLAHLTGAFEIHYEFWPWLQKADCVGCEPDVLLKLKKGGEVEHLVLIEAKFRSGKSSEQGERHDVPVDQLAREWDNLTHLAKDQDATAELVYLTADYGMPRGDIAVSEAAYVRTRPEWAREHPFRCSWLSWRHLWMLFDAAGDDVLCDLARLAERLGLVFFGGIDPIRPIDSITWAFTPPVTRFDWSVRSLLQIPWRFSA